MILDSLSYSGTAFSAPVYFDKPSLTEADTRLTLNAIKMATLSASSIKERSIVSPLACPITMELVSNVATTWPATS